MRLRRTLFISDLHLDASRPQATARFEKFLAGAVPGSDALYVLGDLFEYWIGDDGLALEFPRRMAALLAPVARSLPVKFMHGNRDFLVADEFSKSTGVELIPDPTRIDLYGRKTVLLHGDTLCTDDTAYQAFRTQVRNPAWQRAVLAKPIPERVAMAEGLRAGSEGAKGGKSMQIMDVANAAVVKAFADSGCDVMIHGHTHRPGHHTYHVGGRDRERWVLPDWYGQGGYLEATPEAITPRAL
ncbi:MAG TPA: UDP-2,3-diacylglucosamine diphosphatase [Usitatibacter sp.]|nr:UDP-2,3-diacylglucosamine diphosphatase [Usitatibacter sp.]